MFSDIARVFSSQGVLIPGSESVPVRPRGGKEACTHEDCDCFGARSPFDQSSARLELSAAARKQADAARGKTELSEEQQKQVRELKQRDAEVKAHEQAHIASAGGNTKGGAKFEYEVGPDGRNYAVGGHVDIDASPVPGNPEATLRKAQAVQRAALAPADPSGADRAVAAAASAMARQAQAEKASSGAEGRSGQASPAASPLRGYSRAGAVHGAFQAYA